MIAFVIDIESQKLYPNYGKVWTIVLRQVNSSRVLILNPYLSTPQEIREQIISFIFDELPEGEIPYIIGHNYLGFDGWVLWREYGISMQIGPDLFDGRPVKYFDTLYASQFLLPDRDDGHSLKSWGVRFGDHKIDYYNVAISLGVIKKGDPKGSEFIAHTKEMDEYCDKDTIISERVFLQCFKEIKDQNVFKQFYNGQKGFWLMQAQAFTGFRFDSEYAHELKHIIRKMIQDIRDEVEPKLPSRKLKKTEQKDYVFPAKTHKQDGTFSANMEKFILKHNAQILEDNKLLIYGDEYEIVPKQLVNLRKPISLEDQNELKDYFIEQGWVPTLWNYKKDPKTKKKIKGPDGEPIQMSPKIQETQKICPNLLELEGDVVKLVVKFLSLRNRLSTLISSKKDTKGWINDPRLPYDGRISAGASGIAATHRWKHTKVVNVPKADVKVLLGIEFRSLWVAEKGFKIVAVDQSALEARVQGHFLFPFDGGKGAKELLEGDIHSKNTKAFYPEETKDVDITLPDFTPDHFPAFKPYRSKSKNGYYAIIYGCSPPKLASTLGVPVEMGKTLLENFWSANPALKALKDALEKFWIEKGGKKWILGIDGRRLYSRSQHSLINLLFQSTGAIVMDYALLLIHNKLGELHLDEYGRPHYLYNGKVVRRIGYWHDETEFEAEEEIAEDISKILEWAMVEAGKVLKLNIPLAGVAQIGDNWAETH